MKKEQRKMELYEVCRQLKNNVTMLHVAAKSMSEAVKIAENYGIKGEITEVRRIDQVIVQADN